MVVVQGGKKGLPWQGSHLLGCRIASDYGPQTGPLFGPGLNCPEVQEALASYLIRVLEPLEAVSFIEALITQGNTKVSEGGFGYRCQCLRKWRDWWRALRNNWEDGEPVSLPTDTGTFRIAESFMASECQKPERKRRIAMFSTEETRGSEKAKETWAHLEKVLRGETTIKELTPDSSMEVGCFRQPMTI